MPEAPASVAALAAFSNRLAPTRSRNTGSARTPATPSSTLNEIKAGPAPHRPVHAFRQHLAEVHALQAGPQRPAFDAGHVEKVRDHRRQSVGLVVDALQRLPKVVRAVLGVVAQ